MCNSLLRSSDLPFSLSSKMFPAGGYAGLFRSVKYSFWTCALVNDLTYTIAYVCFLLPQEKHSRLKRLKRLSELEVAMCHCLDETPKLTSILSSGQVPSEDELQHYRGLVGRLEKKKARIVVQCSYRLHTLTPLLLLSPLLVLSSVFFLSLSSCYSPPSCSCFPSFTSLPSCSPLPSYSVPYWSSPGSE